MILLASTMSGRTALERGAPLCEPSVWQARRADLERMMAARGLSCRCLTTDKMRETLRRADPSLVKLRGGPHKTRRPKRSILHAPRAILENKMAALDLCSHGLTCRQMRVKLYEADPNLLPRPRAIGRTRLSKLTEPQLLLAAAAAGIEVIGFSATQIRLKLEGWEPRLPAQPTPAAEPPTEKADGTPSQLRGSRSQCLPAEPPTETMQVLQATAQTELQRAAAAKGVDVIGLTRGELRSTLADCTQSQLRSFRSRCPGPRAQPPRVSQRVLRGMVKSELQYAAAAKGIDVIGLTCDGLRSKLADCTRSQLRGLRSRCPCPRAEPLRVSKRVLLGMVKSELQDAAAAQGIEVIGLTCHVLRSKLADCTPSQSRGLRSRCPPAEPPTEAMRAIRGMSKPELQRAAAAQGIDVIGLNRDELKLKLAGWTPRPLKASSRTSCPPVGLPSEASMVLALSDDDEVMTPSDSPVSPCAALESDWPEAAEPAAKDAWRI